MSNYGKDQHILNGNKLFKFGKNIVKHWQHYVLLSVCEFLSVVPVGLHVSKPACISDVSESFHSQWRGIENSTSRQFVSLLKEEHLRISYQLEHEFWSTLPHTIASSPELALKTWMDQLSHKIDTISKQWEKTSHKSYCNGLPSIWPNAKTLPSLNGIPSSQTWSMFEMHFKPDFCHVTDNRKQRRRKRAQYINNVDLSILIIFVVKRPFTT